MGWDACGGTFGKEVLAMKKSIKMLFIFVLVLFLGLVLTACDDTDVEIVRILSGGEEHVAESLHIPHFHTCDYVACGYYASRYVDELIPISLQEDFEVIIEGIYGSARIYFHQYDDRNVIVLRGRFGNYNKPDEIFLTHGYSWSEREEWEQVDAESMFDLLEPGVYLLNIHVSWENSNSGFDRQYFFKLIR